MIGGAGAAHRVVLGACVTFAVVATASLVAAPWNEEGAGGKLANPRKTLASNDPVTRACALDPAMLVRVWRGYHPGRSEDLTFVPREPNHIGTFTLTSHSGPWDYLQNVPLVFYGPGRIKASGNPVPGVVNMTDVYPTVGRLLGATLEPRAGRVLDAALEGPGRTGPPKLVVVVVWDGAGRTTLDRWPDRWPNLRRMEREGTSFLDATVGSSPSITSVVHSTLGTGTWPSAHGITSNVIRTSLGGLQATFSDLAARELQKSTFADQIDLALDNEPRVGTLAWKSWHLGMMGHGASIPGADADEVALLHYRDGMEVLVNRDFYASPPGLVDGLDPTDRISELDRADGAVDGRWMGHEISIDGGVAWDTYSNPAWARYQTDVALKMMTRGEYGLDEVPDFFFMNYKMTDLAGHQWGSESEETASVVAAQDAALGRIVDYLDREVGDYVVVLTADHGTAPLAEDSGAWPISQAELIADVNRHFDISGGDNLVLESAAFGWHIDRELMEAENVSTEDVAEFMNGYTIADNWKTGGLPEGYAGREREQVFSAAFPTAEIDRIIECSFGQPRPPSDFEASAGGASAA